MSIHITGKEILPDTESKILEGAKKIFILKGLDGARMQEIADEAGINKALLHYYFRSKQKLFEAVFTEVFAGVLPKVTEIINSDAPLLYKIEKFVDSYIDLLLKNPLLPIFILNELYHQPGKLINLVKSSGIHPEVFFKQIKSEIETGNIRNIKPEHLIVNMISLCVFPFAGRPVIEEFMFNGDKKKYIRFIGERKEEIKKFIINSISV